MKGILSLLLSLALAGSASAASTGPAETLAVLALDDARMGQLRYLNLLLDRLDVPQPETNMYSCMADTATAEEAESCIRSGNGSSSPQGIVLILNDAGLGDPGRPGLARFGCVGLGTAASDSDRQSITLWPRAYGLRSVTPFAEDGRNLRDCVAAARAEVAP